MNHRQFGPRTNAKEKEQVRKPLGHCTQPQPARGTLWGLLAQPPDQEQALGRLCTPSVQGPSFTRHRLTFVRA